MLPHLTNDIQASVNQMSGAGKLVQQALGSMLEILKQEVFNATTVNLSTFNWTSLVQKPMQPQYFVCGQYFCSLLFHPGPTLSQVKEVVWGYDHPLIKLGNDVLPAEQKLPFDKFGFFVNVSVLRVII